MDAGYCRRNVLGLLAWSVLAVLCHLVNKQFVGAETLPSGFSALIILALVFSVLAVAALLRLLTSWYLALRRRPVVEAEMIGRLYTLAAILAIFISIAFGLGRLEAFGTFFATFGGMLMGWSLQAPVSGFAAWVLVSMKRPFRPGDRVQFPNLGLTGDVKDIGVMYTVLDQVGGTIGSEEAVGRFILVPNAMLFSQVAINYTVTQDQPYILDEVVVRITFNSNWEKAEKILLDAAVELTREVIEKTGQKPYIRSDLYDYGVYLRLRYYTPVKDRAENAYKISKRIFEQIQREPEVDLAIPFVYSARVGARGAARPEDSDNRVVQELEIENIRAGSRPMPPKDVVDQLAHSISAQGLLQPIVVIRDPQDDKYDILAGDLRFEACKSLGWKSIPVVVKGR